MRALFLCALLLMATACDKQIKDFVNEAVNNAHNPAGSPTSSSAPLAMKLSPGANLSMGTQTKSHFTITPTQRTVAGSTVKTTFSFHETRSE